MYKMAHNFNDANLKKSIFPCEKCPYSQILKTYSSEVIVRILGTMLCNLIHNRICIVIIYDTSIILRSENIYCSTRIMTYLINFEEYHIESLEWFLH